MSDVLDPYLQEYRYDSMFGTAEVFTMETDDGVPLRCLYVDGGFQSATYLGEDRFQLPFEYCKAFDIVFNRKPEPTSFLMLGGGAFSYPKHLLTAYDDTRIDVVEIDPVVIDIARRHFFVDELEDRCKDRLRAFAEDGRVFLRTAEEGAYDVVINDTFGGTVQDAPLLSEEALLLAKRAMTKGGIYLLNAVVNDDEDVEEDERAQALQELEHIRQVLCRMFANVVCQDVEDENFDGCINHIYIASDGKLPSV